MQQRQFLHRELPLFLFMLNIIMRVLVLHFCASYLPSIICLLVQVAFLNPLLKVVYLFLAVSHGAYSVSLLFIQVFS